MTTSAQKPRSSAGSKRGGRPKDHSRQRGTHSKELLRLKDEFADFADLNAFLCNAFALSLREHHVLTPEIAAGGRLCADWLMQKALKLKAEIRKIDRHDNEINGKEG